MPRTSTRQPSQRQPRSSQLAGTVQNESATAYPTGCTPPTVAIASGTLIPTAMTPTPMTTAQMMRRLWAASATPEATGSPAAGQRRPASSTMQRSPRAATRTSRRASASSCSRAARVACQRRACRSEMRCRRAHHANAPAIAPPQSAAHEARRRRACADEADGEQADRAGDDGVWLADLQARIRYRVIEVAGAGR